MLSNTFVMCLTTLKAVFLLKLALKCACVKHDVLVNFFLCVYVESVLNQQCGLLIDSSHLGILSNYQAGSDVSVLASRKNLLRNNVCVISDG